MGGPGVETFVEFGESPFGPNPLMAGQHQGPEVIDFNTFNSLLGGEFRGGNGPSGNGGAPGSGNVLDPTMKALTEGMGGGILNGLDQHFVDLLERDTLDALNSG